MISEKASATRGTRFTPSYIACFKSYRWQRTMALTDHACLSEAFDGEERCSHSEEAN